MKKQQKGALKLRGTHGDFNFAQTQDGFVWREKAKFDKEAFLKNPQIAKTVSEFTRAGKAVKLLRTAFEKQMKKAKDSRLTSRMQRQLMAVIASDSTHDWGARTVIDGDPVHLQLFQCNPDSLFSAMLGTEYNCSIDRATGEVLFNVPSFVPTRSHTRSGIKQKIHPRQQRQMDKFKLASAYASAINNDPEKKKLYAANLEEGETVYRKEMKEYLNNHGEEE